MKDEKTAEDFNKYKMFRQFMCNELGITRQDIEAWTKQAVANEVQKKLGQLNVDELLTRAIRENVSKAIGNNGAWGGHSPELLKIIALELCKGLKLVDKNQ